MAYVLSSDPLPQNSLMPPPAWKTAASYAKIDLFAQIAREGTIQAVGYCAPVSSFAAWGQSLMDDVQRERGSMVPQTGGLAGRRGLRDGPQVVPYTPVIIPGTGAPGDTFSGVFPWGDPRTPCNPPPAGATPPSTTVGPAPPPASPPVSPPPAGGLWICQQNPIACILLAVVAGVMVSSLFD